MRNILKLLSLTMAMVITICVCRVDSTYAITSEEVNLGENEVVFHEIENKGVNLPQEIKTLSKGERMSFSGKSTWSDLYSNYYFKGPSAIEYCFQNKLDIKLTVYIYKKGLFPTKQKTIIVPPRTTARGITAINSKYTHFIRFSGRSHGGTNFNGYIIRKE